MKQYQAISIALATFAITGNTIDIYTSNYEYTVDFLDRLSDKDDMHPKS